MWTDMQELEKIIQEMQKIKEIMLSPANVDCFGEPCKENDCLACVVNKCMEIVKNHMNGGWIPVEDERLWDILFEEACVEGEQAKRIYNRLKETFGGERSEMDGKF